MADGGDGRRADREVSLNPRKRSHIELEYEGRAESVRVKQEFSDAVGSCRYGGGAHSQPHHEVSHLDVCAVKTEPVQLNGTCSVPLHTYFVAPPSYPLSHNQSHSPYQYFSNAVKSDMEQFNSSASTEVCQYPGTLNPVPQTASGGQHYFPFSPWGLGASTGMGGGTFGSLAGVDMTQSLQGSGEFAPAPNPAEKATSRKGKSPRGPSRLKREMEEDDGWEPPLWRQQLQNIVKMRENRDAPVDLMGAHKNAEQITCVTPEVRRYQVLISLMLSSQTKDQITAQAMRALKRHGLTIENVINTPEEEVAQLIHPVGFWRKKAGYIKRVSQILLDKYGGDIPNTMDQLCSLPGVGPKMSHLVMDIAWDNTSGVAVDTHVHRISHRLGWMREATENPEVTRICIEKWLPKYDCQNRMREPATEASWSEWRELNWLLVGFGQQRCLPNAPKCKGCLNEDICPASKLKGGGPWGKKKKAVKKELTEQP